MNPGRPLCHTTLTFRSDANTGLVEGIARMQPPCSDLKSSPSLQQLPKPLSCLAPYRSITSFTAPKEGSTHLSNSSSPLNPWGKGTHRDHPLQTDIEVLPLVGLQFFERESGLTDKLVMAKFVLITDRDPAIDIKDGERKKSIY